MKDGEIHTLVLYGVFRELRRRGMPLGMRDYLDGLRALRLGYGGAGRNDLRKLCRTLWARADAEARLIDAVFERILPPEQEEIAALQERLPLLRDGTSTQPGRPDPTSQLGDLSGAGSVQDPRIGVDFASPRQRDGLALPRLAVVPPVVETFALQPQTVVSRRRLAVIWRRFRRLTRTGPKAEVDVEATIARRCREGVLPRAVLRPSRVNTARLIVLADVSASMAPWRPFLDTLAASLELSRLRWAATLYFENVPRRSVFRSPTLKQPVPIRRALEKAAGAGLLVISDAGAARGFSNPARVQRTEAFLKEAGALLHPVVWLNPMPRGRWAGTSAESLARGGRVTFLPLDREMLIRAVDILRGARA